MKQTKGLSINRHYFATSHGKGAVDGVGGTVKRAVHNAIMTRRHLVKSAADYMLHAPRQWPVYKSCMSPVRRLSAVAQTLMPHGVEPLPFQPPRVSTVCALYRVDVGQVTLTKYTQQPAPQSHVLIQQPLASILEAVQSATPAHVGTPVVSADLKPGIYMAIPIPTDLQRAFYHLCSYSVQY